MAKRRFYILALSMVFLQSVSISVPAKVQDGIGDVLKKADFYRGGRVPGVMWDLVVQNIERNEIKNELTVLVKAGNKKGRRSALISFLAPRKYRGQKLLLKDHNMWFAKPGLRRPIPISSRQRLTGAASNADVASANYYEDYDVSLSGNERYDSRECYILDLKAKTKLMTYHRIKYWVSVDTNHGLKAEFYGKSGKLIKIAHFKYNNKVLHEDEQVDYISQIIITDNINKEDRTILDLSNIRFEKFNSAIFQQRRMLD